MLDTSTYERPNTVSGLIAKHDELSMLRDKYKAEIKRLADDLQNLRAVIQLFDPKADIYAMKGGVTKPRVRRGALKRFVLTAFRESEAALTSREITEAWAVEQGITCDAETYPDLRRQVSSCLKGCVTQGLIEALGRTAPDDERGSYKLWTLKKGGH